MAVFTLEADYTGETGYPFDNWRQIGNMSQFENGMVLISNQNNPPGFLRQFEPCPALAMKSRVSSLLT